VPSNPGPRKRTTPTSALSSNVPHSWPVRNWPASVYPNDSRKGLYLVRIHGRELLKANALARIGRERIVFGAPYVRWMAKKAGDVPGYELAVNRINPTT
jgi:hypothetical protein